MNIISLVIHHITQVASIALAYIWFGWRGAIVIFLVNWSFNSLVEGAKK